MGEAESAGLTYINFTHTVDSDHVLILHIYFSETPMLAMQAYVFAGEASECCVTPRGKEMIITQLHKRNTQRGPLKWG